MGMPKKVNLLEILPIIVAEIDHQERVCGYSDLFGQWCSSTVIEGQTLQQVLLHDLYEQIQSSVKSAISGHYTETRVHLPPICPKLAAMSDFEFKVHFSPYHQGEDDRVLVVALPLASSEQRLRADRASEYLQITLDTIDQGITIYDHELRLVSWNRTYEEMQIFPAELTHYGCSLLEAYRVIARFGVFGEGDPEALAQEHIEAVRQRKMKAVEELYPPSGRIIRVHRYSLPNGGVCATFTDITEQRFYEKQLINQARTDLLTGIPNRFALMEQLSRFTNGEAENPGTFYLLFIDLDRFKLINDSYGHHVGDQLLSQMAALLGEYIDQQQGDMLARLGGDEFLLLLRSAPSGQEVDSICEEILQRMEQPFRVNDLTVFLSCTIGVSSYPEQGQTSQELLSHADTAMYQAKIRGRKSFQHYTEQFGNRARQRVLAVNALRRQVHIGDSGLQLVYQPIVELDGKHTVGAEALLRWQYLAEFSLELEEFIDVLEEHGMIAEVGQQVFDIAAQDLNHLLAAGASPTFYLSVNASPIQVAHRDFAKQFISRFSGNGFTPAQISLEITESALMNNTRLIQRNLFQIRDAGFKLAIDDFGTGYSSLSHLEKYPFTHLKIDKSFIDYIPANQQKKHLLAAIMDISRAYQMEVIAEGIENEEQLNFLEAVGCHLGQGFYLGKPKSLADLMTILTATTGRDTP